MTSERCTRAVCVYTLAQFVGLDVAGAIGVDALEHPLPVVDVVEEAGKLMQVDAAGSIHVKEIYTHMNNQLYLPK
jgi:hypothetical protein